MRTKNQSWDRRRDPILLALLQAPMTIVYVAGMVCYIISTAP